MLKLKRNEREYGKRLANQQQHQQQILIIKTKHRNTQSFLSKLLNSAKTKQTNKMMKKKHTEGKRRS